MLQKLKYTTTVIILLLVTCKNTTNLKDINYKHIHLTTFFTKKVDCNYKLSSNAVKVKDFILMESNNKGILKINLLQNKSSLLFKEGQGPNEILSPKKIVLKNKFCWINSFYETPYIYRFNPLASQPILERINIKTIHSTDDIEPISNNLIALSNVYWQDGLLKIYNTEKKTCLTVGKPTFIKLMNKFNVNFSSLYVNKNKIYIIQSIVPEIKVFNIETKCFEKNIKLQPPFYKPIPPKYNIDKFDYKGHRKWMHMWTSLNEIIGVKNFILLRYRKGYEFEFY
jgi:hypothetical protein